MPSSRTPPWFASDSVQAEFYTETERWMKDQWVWLYRQRGSVSEHSIGQYSALLSSERAERSARDPGWEAHIGDGGYGFTEYYGPGEERRTTYGRIVEEGIELLVIRRSYDRVRPAELEIAEELRLLFNLWEDRATRIFYSFDESGNLVKEAAIDDEGVRVRANLVRRYQAVKQMHLALYFDTTLWSDELVADDFSWDEAGETGVTSYHRSESAFGDRPFSRLDGKRLFPPPPQEKSGIWPFEREREFETFLIGHTDAGEDVTFTSDPDQLANYFGANQGNPHYLTPVYFRRDVLNRYYADPDRFSVEDGHLYCAGLWGLRIDNDQAGHVMVFLGDLGRDIPQTEAQYWRTFNIPPPEEGPSETLIRRAFGGQFADPQSVDLRFPGVYKRANEAWELAFGWPLFKPLHAEDRHVLGKLHVPVTDGAAEFDEQVLYLAKLLVDSLSESEIKAVSERPVRGAAGLARLERLLTERGLQDAPALLRAFANVQGLRSRGAAHRKGESFDITVALGDLGRRAGFEKLLTDAIKTLDALRAFADGQVRVGEQ